MVPREDFHTSAEEVLWAVVKAHRSSFTVFVDMATVTNRLERSADAVSRAGSAESAVSMPLTLAVHWCSRAHSKIIVTSLRVESAFAFDFIASTRVTWVQCFLEIPVNLLGTDAVVLILMTNEALMVFTTYVTIDRHCVSRKSGTRFIIVYCAAVTA